MSLANRLLLYFCSVSLYFDCVKRKTTVGTCRDHCRRLVTSHRKLPVRGQTDRQGEPTFSISRTEERRGAGLPYQSNLKPQTLNSTPDLNPEQQQQQQQQSSQVK